MISRFRRRPDPAAVARLGADSFRLDSASVAANRTRAVAAMRRLLSDLGIDPAKLLELARRRRLSYRGESPLGAIAPRWHR
jgi:hypothetical protein